MTFRSERTRMKPMLDKAPLFGISTNPDPRAIYKPGSAHTLLAHDFHI